MNNDKFIDFYLTLETFIENANDFAANKIQK